MTPIETRYRGYRFRSRLEARWACYFDAIGLQWEYEPQGFVFDEYDGLKYLPDFWLPQVCMWAEVKPTELTIEERVKVNLLARHAKRPVLLLIGTPAVKAYDYVEWDGEGYVTTDCALSMYHGYPLSEHRFYACLGGGELEPGGSFDDVFSAVDVARSARFEFGESGPR